MGQHSATAHFVARAAQFLLVNRVWCTFRQNALLVLNYHGVVPDECLRDERLYGNVIGVSEFSRQMAALARHFHPISISDLPEWRAGRGTRAAALVTFDDGYRNNLTCAAPVLRRHGVPALFNISTGYIGQDRVLWPDDIYCRVLSWPKPVLPLPDGRTRLVPGHESERRALAGHVREACKRIPHEQASRYWAELREYETPHPSEDLYAFLNWEEVRTLTNLGFAIGSHTVEHPILTQLSEERLAVELRDSKRVIERETGRECTCFAYPNGGSADVSPSVVEQVRRAGYAFAFTVQGGLSSPGDDPLMLDRVYIPNAISDADFQARISGLHGVLRRLWH